jgi:hypothetical protein
MSPRVRSVPWRDTILTALTERRNRLIQLDMEGKVQPRSTQTLRQRVNACTEAIAAVKGRTVSKRVDL